MRNKLSTIDKLKFNMLRSISTAKNKTFWLSIKRCNICNIFRKRKHTNTFEIFPNKIYNAQFSYFRMKNISCCLVPFDFRNIMHLNFVCTNTLVHVHGKCFKKYIQVIRHFYSNQQNNGLMKTTLKKYKHTIHELVRDAHLRGEDHSYK